jgi:hypothetical protein
MFRKGMQQQTVRLAFALILMASVPVLAAGGSHLRPAAAVAHEGSFVTQAWQWLQSLWGEQGGCIDPNGKCASGTTAPPVHTDNGGCIDPDGRCASAATAPQADTDKGGCLDPNGRCASSLHRP